MAQMTLSPTDYASKIQQSKAAGFSDDQIVQHLAQADPTSGQKIQQSLAAGFSPTDIISHLSGGIPQPSSQNQSTDTGLLRKIGNFIAPIGKDIAQAIVPHTAAYQDMASAQQRNQAMDQHIITLLQQAKAAGQMDKVKKYAQILSLDHSNPQPTPESVATNGQGFSTPGQIIGDAAQTGMNLLSGGSLTGVKALEGTNALLAGGKLATEPGVAGVVGRVAGKVGSGAVIGSAQGAATALSNGTNVLEGVKQGAVGGAAGNAAFGLGEEAINALQKVAAKRAASVYDGILGLSKGEAKAEVKLGKQTTGQKIVAEGGLPGLMKTKQGILNTAQQGIDQTEVKIQPIIQKLDASGAKIPVADVVAPLQALKSRSEELGLPTSSTVQGIIDAIIKKGGTEGELTPSVANDLKRAYYEELSNQNFNVPPQELSSLKEALRSAASGLRQGIENVSPQDATGNVLRQLNAEQGFHLAIRNKIQDAIANGEVKDAQDAVKVLGRVMKPGTLLREAAAAGIGSMVAGPAGAIVAPAAAAIANSTPVLTARAKLGTKFAQSALNPDINNAVRRLIARTTASNAVQQ